MKRPSQAVTAFLCTIAALSVFLIPIEVSPAAFKALAITVWMVLFWIFSPVDHAITGIVGCFLYWATGAVNFDIAFSGFSQDTPWFLFGAIIFGAMAAQTGLALRLAYSVMSIIGISYARILLGIIIVDFLMTFIVPSGVSRVVILAAICIGIVDAFGLPAKSNISRGLFIIFTYTATIFDKMLIAGAASILARGLIERDGGVPVYYSQWFLAYLPCDLITVAACWGTVLWLYPPERKELAEGRSYIQMQLSKLGPITAAEKRAAASMIGLGAGLVACLPVIGVLNSEQFKKIDPLPVMLTAAVLSMAAVLTSTKAIEVVNTAFFARVQPMLYSVDYSSMVLYWAGFVYHFFLPEPSNLSTSMPLLMRFAKENNLSPLAIGMIWTFASGGKIFIYQSPVLVVGYSYGRFEAKDLLKVGLVLTLVECLILLFLVPVYWPLIGIH
jgi:di/tricarboxylate transporter